MALISSRFTWPGWPASAIGRSCPAAISRTPVHRACCSSVSANAVTAALPDASARARCAASRT